MAIDSRIFSYWSRLVEKDIRDYLDGKRFDTIYYNPVKPRWIPWRVWFWILGRYFTSKTVWMEKIVKDEGQTAYFTRYAPLRRTGGTDAG